MAESSKNRLDSPSVWVMLSSVAYKSEEMKASEREPHIQDFPSVRLGRLFHTTVL